ncbi:hypothetical protein CAPTEDRAFT_194865 [Capitella teleta]|uniref:G-protein coupled receptors family 1 profile domain-containing protein n=1 Tax=Capitella teleta TaxID=283909 RepID=R7T3M2_CAPTE|nr:hypothetical protein CAPTEDRAFT_194865 [Capitella teleta]|eukprot:ELT87226.1 hypothetical protein CAPTEDRAFT_194865 [Capitella teleta]
MNETTATAFLFYKHPEYYQTVIIGDYCIGPLGVILNGVCAYILWICRKPLSAQKTLLLFVCGNNLLMCSYGLPFTAFDQQSPEIKQANFCTFHAFVYFLLQSYGILILFMVTLNRYFVVVRPTSKRFTFGGPKRTVIIALVTLSIMMLVLLPAALGIWGVLGHELSTGSCVLISQEEGGDLSYNLLGAAVSFGLPVTTMLLCYLHIYFVVRRQNRKVLQGNSFGTSKEQQRRKQELRLLTTTFGMLMLFIAAYLPYLLVMCFPNLRKVVVLKGLSRILPGTHCLSDPVLCLLSQNTYRLKLKRMFHCGKAIERDDGISGSVTARATALNME